VDAVAVVEVVDAVVTILTGMVMIFPSSSGMVCNQSLSHLHLLQWVRVLEAMNEMLIPPQIRPPPDAAASLLPEAEVGVGVPTLLGAFMALILPVAHTLLAERVALAWAHLRHLVAAVDATKPRSLTTYSARNLAQARR
jgi:hypothetical protein